MWHPLVGLGISVCYLRERERERKEKLQLMPRAVEVSILVHGLKILNDSVKREENT